MTYCRSHTQPTVVLGHADRGYRSEAYHYFRRLGVIFVAAETAQEARQLARLLTASVVILDAELPDESGHLTCAKIKADNPECRIVLLGHGDAADGPEFAKFAGADAFVDRADGPEALTGYVLGSPVEAVC